MSTYNPRKCVVCRRVGAVNGRCRPCRRAMIAASVHSARIAKERTRTAREEIWHRVQSYKRIVESGGELFPEKGGGSCG